MGLPAFGASPPCWLEASESCTDRCSSHFENNYFIEICSGPEAGLYLRLIDVVYHSNLDLIVIKKKKKESSRTWVKCS